MAEGLSSIALRLQGTLAVVLYGRSMYMLHASLCTLSTVGVDVWDHIYTHALF